jgi:hypothetical protein
MKRITINLQKIILVTMLPAAVAVTALTVARATGTIDLPTGLLAFAAVLGYVGGTSFGVWMTLNSINEAA